MNNLLFLFKKSRQAYDYNDEAFLKSLKIKLSEHVKLNPPVVRTDALLGHAAQSKRMTASRSFMPLGVIIALVALLGGGGTVAASQRSLPGDALYPVKLASEEIRTAFVGQQSQLALRLAFAQERIKEVDSLLSATGTPDVSDIRSRGIREALDNFQSNIDRAASQAATWKNSGNLERAAEASTQIRAYLAAYNGQLEQLQQKTDGSEKGAIATALGASRQFQKEADNEINDANLREDGRISASDGQKQAQEKMAHAQEKINDATDAFSTYQSMLDASTTQNASDAIAKARGFLESAEKSYADQNYPDAFGNAQDAAQSAVEAKTIIQIGRGLGKESSGNGIRYGLEGQILPPSVQLMPTGTIHYSIKGNPGDDRENENGEKERERNAELNQEERLSTSTPQNSYTGGNGAGDETESD